MCLEPIEDDAVESGGGKAAVLKAMKKKYTARQKTMDNVIKKLNSLQVKVEASIKALSCCFAFVVVF